MTPARISGRDFLVTLCLLLVMGILGWSFLSDYLQHQAQPERAAAEAALKVGNATKATAEFDKMLKLRPKDPDLYRAVCDVCGAYEQWGLMEEYARRGVQACKYAPNDKRAALYVALANALAQTEPHPQMRAIDAATTAQQLDPQDMDVLNTLGYTLADNGQDLDKARELLIQAIRGTERQPDTPDKPGRLAAIEDSYGWLLLKQGQTPEAIDALTQALDDMPEDAEAPAVLKVMYYHLGAAYRKAGRCEEARQALLTALQYDSNYSPAKLELAALPPPTPAPSNAVGTPPAKPADIGTPTHALGAPSLSAPLRLLCTGIADDPCFSYPVV